MWNVDCVERGCRWSTIYYFCAVTMLLLAANSCVQFAGTWWHKLRALGACLASLLCCVNLAAIVTTGVFRFNYMGKLAALSQLDNQYSGMTANNDKIITVVGGRTYQSDGTLIVWLWGAQMLFFLSNSFFSGYATKPTQSDSETMKTPDHQLLTHD